ncbi:flagellar basal-body MS-ring/collar protein FliF [Paraferrimonas sp. SM1919]|uniref:flagellar basal-body MS-ring/collar protein FliF n=1 Tax=Paraferrimonas sp. SM1919 TaxID=2662263 RepID=UPI0013D0FFC8|nr:flagellar basal-body MS-ring/collar protein FliF [Paraferrimonas sp. SM1919]
MSQSIVPQAQTPTASSDFFGSIKEKFSQVNDGNAQQQVVTIAILASVIAAVIVLVLWASNSNYRPLYGTNENYDSAEIISVLDAQGVNYKLDPNNGSILVDESTLSATRMLLASQGVKAQIPAGMELLDSAGGLGSSQFLESARYRQGLEGELARSIMTMKAINHARVHLALPKRTLFIRENPETASASVILQLAPTQELNSSQVEAIINLVTGSVPALAAADVSVTDQYGNLLSSMVGDQQSLATLSSSQLEYVAQVEKAAIKRATDMLKPILGSGNFQVQASAAINFDSIEQTREVVDPQTVVRQQVTKVDNRSESLGLGIPGALSNRAPATPADPQPPANAEQQNDQAQTNAQYNQRQENQTQYEIGRSITHTKFQTGMVEQLSVSVLINDNIAPVGGWQPDQLSQMQTMLADAIGIKADRGDSLSLQSFAFVETEQTALYEPVWWHQFDFQSLARYIIGSLLALALIFFVLRPLVKHLTREPESSLDDSLALEPAIVDVTESEETIAIAEDSKNLSSQNEIDDLFNNIQVNNIATIALDDLPPPESTLQEQLNHLRLLADQEPNRVADVVKSWLENNKAR